MPKIENNRLNPNLTIQIHKQHHTTTYRLYSTQCSQPNPIYKGILKQYENTTQCIPKEQLIRELYELIERVKKL